MNNRILLVLGTALCVLSACDDDASPTVEMRTTPAGWEYAYLPIKDAEGWKIAFLTTSTWSRRAPAAHNPLAMAMISDMLNVSGYDDLAAVDKQAAFEDLQSNASVYTNDDGVSGEIYVDVDELDTAMPMFIGSFNRPKFEPTWLERIQPSYVDGYRDYIGTDDGLLGIMSGHRLAQLNDFLPLSQEAVDRLGEVTTQDLDDWLSHLDGHGLGIGVAGAGDPQKLDAYLDELLARFDPKADIAPLPEFIPPERKSIALINPDAENATVAKIYYEASNNDCPDCLGWETLASIAMNAGGVSSRLNQPIRGDNSASYGVDASTIDAGTSYGGLWIGGQIAPEQLGEAIASIDAVIEDLRTNGFSDDDQDAIKDYSQTLIDNLTEDENTAAYFLAASEFYRNYYGDEGVVEAFIARLGNIKKAALNDELIGGLPAPSAFSTFVITPDATGLDVDCVIADINEIDQCYS